MHTPKDNSTPTDEPREKKNPLTSNMLIVPVPIKSPVPTALPFLV